MSENVLDHKIPSLAGFGIITIGIIATTFLVKGPTPFQIKASPLNEPKNIQITNISDSAFTVVYNTDDKVTGTILYGENPEKLDKVILDERDQLSQEINDYKTHSITANNLTPNTEYFFVIKSGDKTIKSNEEAFTVKTGSSINGLPSNQVTVTGKVINPNASSVSDGLVIVTIDGAQKISGIIKNDGNYTVPLNNIRTLDLSNYFNLDEGSMLNINAISEGLTSKATASINQLSPVPIITLSNNYDFSSPESKISNNFKERDVTFPEFDSKIKKVTITPSPILTPKP
jgi:hypothetical protein